MQNNNGMQESGSKRASRPSDDEMSQQSERKRSRREEPLSEEEWLRQELIRLGAVSWIHVSPFLRHEDFTEVAPEPVRRMEMPDVVPSKLTTFVDDCVDGAARYAKRAAKAAKRAAKKARRFVKRKWRDVMGNDSDESDTSSWQTETDYLSARSDSPVENYGAPEDDRWYWEEVNETMFDARLCALRDMVNRRSVSPPLSWSSTEAEEDEVPETGSRRLKRRRSI